MFPRTRHSVLEAIAGGEAAERRLALEALAEAYWRPVYTYLRLRWGAPATEAEDLTQGFFARALEKGFFGQYDARRARFRTWLRTCLDGYVSNERAAARRLKRGGGAVALPLDFPGLEAELQGSAAWPESDVEELFRREWIRGLFASALAELEASSRAAGREVHLELFRRYDLEPPAEGRPTYADLAREFGLPVTQVTNQLAAVRREFRRLVLERLRAATASDEEFRREARDLIGEPPA